MARPVVGIYLKAGCYRSFEMQDILKIAIKKSMKSPCRDRVVAIGFDKKNDLLGAVTNTPRFNRLGGSIHAEMKLIRRYKHYLDKIFIFRINKTGGFLPIHPCAVCQKNAERLGIKIISFDS